jgi:hypothetical protein
LLHGKPASLRLNNGSEFTSIAFTECTARGIEPRFIQPGKPDQNAFIDFNKTYRNEVLDAYVFDSIERFARSPTASAVCIQVDRYGTKQPHKAQYMVKGDRIYEADSHGRIRYDRPSCSVEKNGKVVQTDAYGNRLYGKPQFVIQGNKVYAADAYGAKQQRFEVKQKK